METKTTEELRNEIRAASDIEDYLASNRENLILPNLSRHLNLLLSRKGLSKAEVVRGSQLSRAYVYQIFSGQKTPSRDKLIALAFGLRLSCEETEELLKTSKNQKLYARDKRDAVILFALQRSKTILEANDLLFDNGLETLGAPED